MDDRRQALIEGLTFMEGFAASLPALKGIAPTLLRKTSYDLHNFFTADSKTVLEVKNLRRPPMDNRSAFRLLIALAGPGQGLPAPRWAGFAAPE
jgi:hypothetical protein